MAVYLSRKQQEILRRAGVRATTGNYEDALDGDISRARAAYARAADYAKSKHFIPYREYIPSTLSNCTLTATQWVDPSTPLLRARSIIDNGSKYGYVQVPEAAALPADLVITTNPEKDVHHTMLLSGFSDRDQKHTFYGKTYDLPEGHPLVTYSNGSTHSSGYRSNIGLKEYLDNSDGKDLVRYYRHTDPNEHLGFIGELVVTPNGSQLQPIKYKAGGSIKRRYLF